MSAALLHEPSREAYVRDATAAVRRSSRQVDALVRTFEGEAACPPSVLSRLESLRNKRDTLLNKLEALRHHSDHRWNAARDELEEARRECREGWRLVLGSLEREKIFT